MKYSNDNKKAEMTGIKFEDLLAHSSEINLTETLAYGIIY